VSATLEVIMPREALLEALRDDPRYQWLLTIVLVQFGEGPCFCAVELPRKGSLATTAGTIM
jgi:hypothetical protein